MKNDIKLPEGVNPKPFYLHLEEHLSNNLGDSLIHSISNLLAIDYSLRLKSTPELKEYVKLCGSRLKKHLDQKIIFNETFSSVMSLFAIAITPEKQNEDDNDKSIEQSQDTVIESVISSHFGDLSLHEQQIIRLVLKDLLSGKDGKELLTLVMSDPKLFHSTVLSAIKAKKQQHEISEFVGIHLNSILSQSKTLDQKVTGLKSTFAKIALAGGIIIAASIGVVVGGLALPALILPATLYAVKYGPSLGEKVGTIVAQNIPNIANEASNLDQLKKAVKEISIDTPKLTTSIGIKNELSPKKTKELAKTVELKSMGVAEVADRTKLDKALPLKSKPANRGRHA
jgi:hypothetical protein